MKITQGSIIAALALAATSPAMGAPVGLTSPDPAESTLSPRAASAAGFAGHRPALRRSTGAPIKMVERAEYSMMHGLGFEMEDRSIDEPTRTLAQRDNGEGSFINPLPIVGPVAGPLVTTVAKTVAGLPVVGPLVQTVGQAAAGLPIAGPLVKTLGNGLNLGPIIDPKVNLATGGGNNFAAQQQPQQFQQSVDPVTGLLTGLPLAGGLAQGLDLGGLTNGLPLNTATGLLNNLPLGQVIQTAQGAVPLGAVLGAAGGLANGLPLGGQNGRNPLAALQGIIGADGQTYYSGSALQGLLGGGLGQIGNLQAQAQQATQPVRDAVTNADNAGFAAQSTAWSQAQQATGDATNWQQQQQQLQAAQQQAAYWAQQQAQALQQQSQQPNQQASVFASGRDSVAQAQQNVPFNYGAFLNNGFKAEVSGGASGSSDPVGSATSSSTDPLATAEPTIEALVSPLSLKAEATASSAPVESASSWSESTSVWSSSAAAPAPTQPSIVLSMATPSDEFPASVLLEPSALPASDIGTTSSSSSAVVSSTPLARRNTILDASLAPLRLDVQAGTGQYYDEEDDTDSCDFQSCEDEASIKSQKSEKRPKFVKRFAAKMKRFLKNTRRARD